MMDILVGLMTLAAAVGYIAFALVGILVLFYG